jgi:hypothetical protein
MALDETPHVKEAGTINDWAVLGHGSGALETGVRVVSGIGMKLKTSLWDVGNGALRSPARRRLSYALTRDVHGGMLPSAPRCAWDSGASAASARWRRDAAGGLA